MLTEKSLVKVYMAVYSVHDQLVDTKRSAGSRRRFHQWNVGFLLLVGLVLPDVSVNVKVCMIYVLAACSSHQTYKGSPQILHTSTNSRTSTWHMGLTGERTEAVLRMLKRPLFMIRFVGIFFIISKNKLHSFVSQRLNTHSCTTTLARSLHAWWLLHPLLHQCTRSGSFRRKTTKGE